MFYEHGYRGELFVDLTGCQFIAVPGHMALITAGRLWHGWTRHPLCLASIDPEVHAYLDRMDIFDRCASFLSTDQLLPPHLAYNRSASTTNLLEVTAITSEEQKNEHDVRSVMRRASDILGVWYTDRRHVNQVLTLLSEVTTNITHSHDIGYVLIQRYRDPSEISASRVVVAITDAGIGIQASLTSLVEHLPRRERRRFRQASDYITYALEEGVTSRPNAGGLGLAGVRRRVTDWRGHLTIRSGTSRVDISAFREDKQDDLVYVPGTQVVIQVWGT